VIAEQARGRASQKLPPVVSVEDVVSGSGFVEDDERSLEMQPPGGRASPPRPFVEVEVRFGILVLPTVRHRRRGEEQDG